LVSLHESITGFAKQLSGWKVESWKFYVLLYTGKAQ